MDRRQRRRREREKKKLEKEIRRQATRPQMEQVPQSRARRFLGKARARIKLTWLFVAAGLSLLSVYAGSLRPHISVEPSIALNPVDPYATQFTVKNENRVFDAHDIECACWPRQMSSENGFSVLSFAPLQKLTRKIAVLTPGMSSTIDCPPVIGGIGTYSGEVHQAELEIDVSYKQSWWPFAQGERYPFAALRDIGKAVHWVHITPDQEKPFPSPRRN